MQVGNTRGNIRGNDDGEVRCLTDYSLLEYGWQWLFFNHDAHLVQSRGLRFRCRDSILMIRYYHYC